MSVAFPEPQLTFQYSFVAIRIAIYLAVKLYALDNSLTVAIYLLPFDVVSNKIANHQFFIIAR